MAFLIGRITNVILMTIAPLLLIGCATQKTNGDLLIIFETDNGCTHALQFEGVHLVRFSNENDFLNEDERRVSDVFLDQNSSSRILFQPNSHISVQFVDMKSVHVYKSNGCIALDVYDQNARQIQTHTYKYCDEYYEFDGRKNNVKGMPKNYICAHLFKIQED